MAVVSEPVLSSPAPPRVLAIDAFRGLTMLVMIFANHLEMAGIRDVPPWMRHAVYSVPAGTRVDHITFVDVIAPAFLFIVGAAIPLALDRRRARGESPVRVASHVLARSVSLMIMGVFLGNMRCKNVCPVGLSHAAWSVLMLASLTLVWNDYPPARDWRKVLYAVLRGAGLAALIVLALLYRREQNNTQVGMELIWHVLGAIGWSYLVACLVYAFFRRQPAGIAGALALLVLLWIADHAGAFDHIARLAAVRKAVPFGHLVASHAVIAVAGMMVGVLFTAGSPAPSADRRIRWIAAVGLMAFLAGLLLRPVYGLSKPATTPAWSLTSIACCCLLFAVLYWLTDVRGLTRWTAPATPAGRNPLAAYFLHYLLHPLAAVTGLEWLNGYLNAGWVGIGRTLAVTLVLGVALTAALTRLRVRPRL